MTDKELKRLSRLELLEMLVSQIEENKDLQKKLDEANEKLRNQDIIKEKAGSIAEAALQLNEVFNAADKAASQYLENIRRINENQEAACEKIIADAQNRAEEIIQQAEETARVREQQADEYCSKLSEEQEFAQVIEETLVEDEESEEVGADASIASEEEREEDIFQSGYAGASAAD